MFLSSSKPCLSYVELNCHFPPTSSPVTAQTPKKRNFILRNKKLIPIVIQHFLMVSLFKILKCLFEVQLDKNSVPRHGLLRQAFGLSSRSKCVMTNLWSIRANNALINDYQFLYKNSSSPPILHRVEWKWICDICGKNLMVEGWFQPSTFQIAKYNSLRKPCNINSNCLLILSRVLDPLRLILMRDSWSSSIEPTFEILDHSE